jgi:hypothetical protein
MTKLTGAALDRKVAQAMGLKSVHNCEAWGPPYIKTPEDEEFERIEREIKQHQAPPAAPVSLTYSIKLTQGQRVKLMRLGGPKWIRAQIDVATIKK